MQAFSKILTGAAVLGGLLAAGCSDSLVSTSPSYKAGELGNGGFQFTCDDSVACNKFNAASEFPNEVAQGATFKVRYVPRDATTSNPGSGSGITVAAVGDAYLSGGPEALVGVKAGLGTITARNAQGALVEFTTIKIEKPDAIVVYDGDYTGTTPTTISKVTAKVGTRVSLRALARKSGHDLAGQLGYQWSSDTLTVIGVDGVSKGKVTLVAKAAGMATLKVEGGGFTQDIPVEVLQ